MTPNLTFWRGPWTGAEGGKIIGGGGGGGGRREARLERAEAWRWALFERGVLLSLRVARPEDQATVPLKEASDPVAGTRGGVPGHTGRLQVGQRQGRGHAQGLAGQDWPVLTTGGSQRGLP